MSNDINWTPWDPQTERKSHRKCFLHHEEEMTPNILRHSSPAWLTELLLVGYGGPQVVVRFLSEAMNKELKEETRSDKQSQGFIEAK
jgi:hypothetical protein